MMQVFITSILLFIGFTARSQVGKHGPPCGGMDVYDAGVHIKSFKVLNANGIRYSEISANSFRNGFTISTDDTSYQVKRFLVVYENASGVKECQITGNKATVKNAAFLKGIKPGDQLSIECINISKGGVTNLSTAFKVVVSN